MPATANSRKLNANKPPDKAPPKLNVLVKLGKVSLGRETVSVRCTIEQPRLTLERADHNLCGRRLVGRLVACGADEDERQTNFIEPDRTTIEGAFDVASMSVNPEAVGFTLSFGVRYINPVSLARLANQTGRLIIDQTMKLSDVPDVVEPVEGQGEFEEEDEADATEEKSNGRRKAKAK